MPSDAVPMMGTQGNASMSCPPFRYRGTCGPGTLVTMTFTMRCSAAVARPARARIVGGAYSESLTQKSAPTACFESLRPAIRCWTKARRRAGSGSPTGRSALTMETMLP